VAHQGVHRDSLEWTDSVVTRATIWSPIGQRDNALPTLIFSPGFGAVPSQYSTLLSRWAREGYLVIAVAHPEFTNPDEMELYDASNVIARHLVRAVDHILREHYRAGSPFSRVDPERIGLVGHSVGGSAAAQAAAWDSRVRAAMDLDGTIFGDVVHSGMDQPFFLLRKRIFIDPNDPPQFFEHRDQGNLHEDSVFVHTTTMYWLTVDNLDHTAFTDAALEAAVANSGNHSAARIHEITTRYVLDFFGHYLSGVPRSARLDQSPFAGTELRFKR
jgi:pimeloyl-ACP methyl ester carboxylesterase